MDCDIYPEIRDADEFVDIGRALSSVRGVAPQVALGVAEQIATARGLKFYVMPTARDQAA